MVVDEDDDLVSGKRVDCFRKLSVRVDSPLLFQPVAVQSALGICRLDETAERVWLAPVVLLDFMEDTLPDEIADRDPLGGHGQGELEERLTCRRLVMYRQGCWQRGYLGAARLSAARRPGIKNAQ